MLVLNLWQEKKVSKKECRYFSVPPISSWYCLCVQDFIDGRDVMPSITMENNVIHNNEGYGVIVVKPNNHEEWRVSKDASEGTWGSHYVMVN